jgi:hypothetical protein
LFVTLDIIQRTKGKKEEEPRYKKIERRAVRGEEKGCIGRKVGENEGRGAGDTWMIHHWWTLVYFIGT